MKVPSEAEMNCNRQHGDRVRWEEAMGSLKNSCHQKAVYGLPNHQLEMPLLFPAEIGTRPLSFI